ncbi:MAG: porin family protein [Desulfobacteraceae bacterium]|nr:porin family protein [Desulfobacteraceae bacterium]
MKKIIFFFMCAVLLIPAIGAADTKVGILPGFAVLTVEDPDGDTDNESVFVPFALAMTHDFDSQLRLYSEFAYYDFDLDAGTDKIGQEVSGYQLSASVQRLFKFSHALQFYAGFGLAYTNAEFKDRYTVDSDGFLDTRYDDRDESFLSGLVSLSREWDIAESISLGFHLSYQHAFGDGIKGFKPAFSAFYRF